MKQQFAMEVCRDCVHREVCIYEDNAREFAEISPIDLTNANCEAYISEGDLCQGVNGCSCEGCSGVGMNNPIKDMEMQREMKDDTIYSAILTMLSVFREQGYNPIGVALNSTVCNRMYKEMKLECKQPITSIMTPYGAISIMIDDNLSDDTIYLMTELEGGN